jgi:hypothetical protein
MTAEKSNRDKLFSIIAYCLIISSAIFKLAFIGRPLIGHYDSEGHLYNLMGMSLVKYGFFKLGFIPLNNSGLLTNPPDYYAHWPILYPNVLALCFKIFGMHVEVGRIITAVASTLSSWLLFDILRRKTSQKIALFTTFIFIVSPVNLYYSFWIGRTFVALTLWLAAIRSLVIYLDDDGKKSNDLIIACVWFSLASLVSWEPILTIFGLVAMFFITKERVQKRAAITCGVVLLISFVVQHVFIFIIAPHLLMEQINAYLIRSYGHTNVLPPRPILNWILLIINNMYISFGIIILVSSLLGSVLLIRLMLNKSMPHLGPRGKVNLHISFDNHDKPGLLNICILLISMPLFWFVVAPRQAFDHDYEIIFWIPFISFTAAYSWNYFLQHYNNKIVTFVAISLFLILIGESYTGFKRYYTEDFTKDYNEYITNLKDQLGESDILLMAANDFSKPTSAFFLGCFIKKVRSKEEVIKFIELSLPEGAKRCLYLRNEANVHKMKDNSNDFLSYVKNLLRKYHRQLKFETYPELSKWIVQNFPRHELPNGLVLYDLTILRKSHQ